MREVWHGEVWNREHEGAFRTLKGALVTAPVLAMPKPEGRYVLACDASDIAWGAVLSQLDAEGREHPIAYYSKKLQPSERKWDVWERECACTVWATDKCRWYLLGKEFDLVTDSKVVLSLQSRTGRPGEPTGSCASASSSSFPSTARAR